MSADRARRLTNPKRDQRDRGRCLGGKEPFGFKVEKVTIGDKVQPVLKMVPVEQAIIAEIRSLRAGRRTYRGIQTDVEGSHGRRVALATIKRLCEVQEKLA